MHPSLGKRPRNGTKQASCGSTARFCRFLKDPKWRDIKANDKNERAERLPAALRVHIKGKLCHIRMLEPRVVPISLP